MNPGDGHCFILRDQKLEDEEYPYREVKMGWAMGVWASCAHAVLTAVSGFKMKQSNHSNQETISWTIHKRPDDKEKELRAPSACCFT